MENNDLFNKTFNAIYADGKFEQIKLGSILNKGGAAGKIYENQNNPRTVAKIYHDKAKSNTNRQKLEAMLHNIPNLPSEIKNDIEYIQIAWPIAILEDEEGFCVGYLMPRIDTSLAVSLDHLMQKAIRQKLKLPEKYSYRVLAAYNLTAMVAAMHKCGHYIVDLKPSNVFIYKSTMTVVMFDCDGFSILGKNGRYPAEYVSEEYIYPEGIEQTCAEMGEEQDKFALAVTIFKLLNNGIHPFSGTPKKNQEMISVQDRIFDYHYAYGFWPDLYQDPHPYSIHEYFDKSTLDMFERAFVKKKDRPSAKEWQDHLAYLLKSMKKCKKNHNHAYFTNKGCGLCIVEEKFNQNIETLRKKKSVPAQIRGIDINDIDIKKVEQVKEEEKEKILKLRKIAIATAVLYFIFFSSLYFITKPFSDHIKNIGKGAQLIVIILITILMSKLITFFEQKTAFKDIYGIKQMLMIFAIACMLLTFITLNDFPQNFWSLN